MKKGYLVLKGQNTVTVSDMFERENMKMITEYEVEGCWTADDNNKCRNCGAQSESVPEEGHFNSKYAYLARDDGMRLVCCPNGCSVEDSDKAMREFLKFKVWTSKGSESFNWTINLAEVSDGWIDRKGKVFPCQSQDHVGSAQEYFGDEEGSVEKKGFIKISSCEFTWGGKPITKKQINSIVDWCNANNKKSEMYIQAYENKSDLFICGEEC